MASDSNILTRGLAVLRRIGIRISEGDLRSLAIVLPDGTNETATTRTLLAPPTPSQMISDLARKPVATIMYFVPRPGAAVTKAALDGDVHLVALEPLTVIIRGTVLSPANPADLLGRRTVGKRSPRASWGRWAVTRVLLLAAEPLKQTEISEIVGISQPAVSQALKQLQHHALRNGQGWQAQHRGDLLKCWLEEYPGPGGVTTHWYGLDAPLQQAGLASNHAAESGADPLISGDVAADTYAPWRLPRRAHLYVREFVDFSTAGFSAADDKDATLVVTLPEDTTIWRTANLRQPAGGPALADPLTTLWDVIRSGGGDAAEAAEHLSKTLAEERLNL